MTEFKVGDKVRIKPDSRNYKYFVDAPPILTIKIIEPATSGGQGVLQFEGTPYVDVVRNCELVVRGKHPRRRVVNEFLKVIIR